MNRMSQLYDFCVFSTYIVCYMEEYRVDFCVGGLQATTSTTKGSGRNSFGKETEFNTIRFLSYRRLPSYLNQQYPFLHSICL